MQRCPQGHYYDPTRYSRCPACGIPDLDVQPTRGRAATDAGAAPAEDIAKTRGRNQPAPPGAGEGRTVGLIRKRTHRYRPGRRLAGLHRWPRQGPRLPHPQRTQLPGPRPRHGSLHQRRRHRVPQQARHRQLQPRHPALQNPPRRKPRKPLFVRAIRWKQVVVSLYPQAGIGENLGKTLAQVAVSEVDVTQAARSYRTACSISFGVRS